MTARIVQWTSFDRLKGAALQASYICGWEAFSLPAYVSGADGVVAGSAAVMPDREVELHRLVQDGAWDDVWLTFPHGCSGNCASWRSSLGCSTAPEGVAAGTAD